MTTTTLLTPKQVADQLRISESTLKRWRLEKKGPKPIYLSATVIRYRPETVESWVNENQPPLLEEGETRD